MGKNKKNKKRGRKKPLSRANFIAKVCEKCLVCGEDTDAEFCYDVMYLKNPHIFNVFCKELLTAIDEWIIDEDESICQENIELFEEIFCQSNMCPTADTKGCRKLPDCIDAFYSQIKHSYNIEDADSDWEAEIKEADCTGMGWSTPKYQRSAALRKQKKKKHKNKQKAIPTATFFCNDPAKWEKRIQRILYGNNNSKQNKAKGASGELT